MPRLSDFTLKNLPIPATGRITVWDEGSPLGVRVTPAATKTFIVMLGSGKRHTIGRYGEVTLSQAREAARRLRAEKTLGRIFPASVSVAEARKQYLAQLDIRGNTRAYYERNLARLRAAKLSDITSQEINRIVASLGQARLSKRSQSYARSSSGAPGHPKTTSPALPSKVCASTRGKRASEFWRIMNCGRSGGLQRSRATRTV